MRSVPMPQALQAIVIATEHEIAILGLEAFEVKKEGLLTVRLADASSYIRFTGDWKTYVARMNTEAEHWLREHRLGENHGYILTSASEREFASLTNRTNEKIAKPSIRAAQPRFVKTAFD